MKKIILVIIIGLAIFWRFWDFDNRWVLNQDQGRDVTMAIYALRNGVTPEIGSPSSAGPFNFGPWYHWIIMVWEKVIPTVNGPWIGFGIMSVVSVIFYYLAGGWIVGLLAAVTAGMVQNSPDMLNTVLVGFGVSMAWVATKKLLDTNSWKWAVLVGFGVGLSINFHFQALGMLALPLAIFLVRKFNFKSGLLMVAGLFTAFIPLVIFDIKNNGIWIKSVIEYYTVGVNKFYVPVRWLTEIKDFWPNLFGATLVGVDNFGYVLIILGIIILITNFKLRISNLKKINKFWWVVGLVFIFQIFLMRNYKGVRSREYLIAFQGMIILITSWIVTEWYKFNKYVGVIILGVMVVMASINSWQNIQNYPSQAKDILEVKRELDTMVSGSISIEQYEQSDMMSMPIFYLYYRENRIGEQNKVSICDGNKYSCPEGEAINKKNYKIYLGSQNWYKLTPENIYQRLMVNYQPFVTKTEGKFVTIVNPIRSRELWQDKSFKPIDDQYGVIDNLDLKATWLIQNDVLNDSELITHIKSFNKNQELGLFLEISKDLAYKSRVYFDGQRPWYDPGVVFLSGYNRQERIKLIDKMMRDFEDTFGYIPKSVGAWWIDSYSQQYLENKYGIKTIMIVADQKTTDSYGVRGQWWGVPFHPDPDNILIPGNSKTVVIQWAQRDLEKAYVGEGKQVSNFSLQANDYTSIGLNFSHFENLAKKYLEAGQITVGLETGMESVGQEKEYEKQLTWIKNNGVKSATMSEFGDLYGSTNPEKVIMENWVMTKDYRENKMLGDRVDYEKGKVFVDFENEDKSSFLNRIYKSENLVEKTNNYSVVLMVGLAILIGFWLNIKLTGVTVLGLWVTEHLRYTVVDGEKMIGFLLDSFRFVGINFRTGLINTDLSNLVAKTMLKINFEYSYLIIWIAIGLIIRIIWKKFHPEKVR